MLNKAALAALQLLAIEHQAIADPLPGAADLSVTQDNVQTTICVKGWTKAV